MPVGEALIGVTHATKVTALNPSLFQSGLFAKVIVGALVSLFVSVSTVCTVGVVVWRANYRSPGPVNDYFETWKNTPIEMAVLKNDRAEAGGAPGDDGDKNSLKLVSVFSPLHGVAVVMDSKKHVKYTPFTSYAGPDTFQYVVTNGKKEATGNVTIKVKNHAPDPVDDKFELQKNIPAVLDVLANDNDIDVGDVLKIVSCTKLFENDMGNLTVAADGKSIDWNPNEQYVGTASFAYTVSDGNDTAAATVFLTVVNNPPVAEPDEFTVNRSTTTNLDVLKNDHDPNKDTMEILNAGNQDFGFITFTKSFVTYTPKFNSTSTDSFDYTIWDKARDNDGNMFTSQANVIVRIVNPDPNANSTHFDFNKNSGPHFINLNALASSPIAHITETMSIVSDPQHGAFSLDHQSEEVDFTYLNENHTYTKNTYTLVYTPATNYVGADEVKYQITDDVGKFAIGTISINVVNNPPTPADDFAEVARNSRTGVTIAVLLNDTDPNGDSLVLNTGLLEPAHGRATYSGDSITYIPTAGYFGADSFQYSVSDVSVDSQTSKGTVYVNVRNDPPVPYDDSFGVPKNVAKDLDVLANDVDPNQDILSIVSYTEDPAAIFKGHKEIIASNPPVIRYTPVAGQIYEETFQYTVSDGDSTYARTASVYVNVTNTAPTPVDEQVVSHWTNVFDYDLLANDIDENGDTLAINSLITFSQNGYTTCTQLDSRTIRVVVDHGGYIYSFSSNKSPMKTPAVAENGQKRTPDSHIVGYDFCIYTITDGQALGTRQASLRITVMDSPPVVVDDEFTVHVDTTIKWPASAIIANDYDDDPNDEVHLAYVTLVAPNFGTATFDGVDVTFSASQTGTTHIYYGITDGCYSMGTLDGEITVHVINDPPVAVDDTFYYGANLDQKIYALYVGTNDYDPEHVQIRIVPSSVPATSVLGNTLSVEMLDRVHVYITIPEGFIGNDTFTYQVTDGHDVSNFATVHVNVMEGQPPEAVDDYLTMHWRYSNVYKNVTLNDKPGQFPQLTVTEITPGLYTESVTIAPDNQGIIYTPKHDVVQSGTQDVLTYKITDGVFTVSAMLRVTLSDVPPFCKNDSASYDVHWRTGTSSVNALANDTDVNGDTIWISNIKPPMNARGAGSLQADKATVSFTFAANLDFLTLGTVDGDRRVVYEMIPYVVTDSKLSSDCFATFYMYDRAPIAVDDSFTAFKNSENFELNVLANDYDPDTVDTPFLSIVSVTAQQGIAVINYNPLRVNFIKGFSGNAILKYQVTDGKLKSAQATITIDVQNRAPVCSTPSFQVPKSYGHTQTSSIFDVVGLACTDADGDTIELSAVGSSSIGSTGLSNNKATFVPTENHSGQSTISFTVTDRQSSTDSTFTVTVVNQAPVATSFTDSFSRNQFQFKEYTPTISDPDNDVVTITGIAPAPGSGGVQDGPTRVNFTTSGYVDLIPGNKLRFTQTLSGLLSVTFTVSDGDLDNPLTASGTATVTIIGNPPIARDDSFVVNQGESLDLYVMTNDTDPDGDAIWIDPADWLVGPAPTPITPVLMTDASGAQFFRFDASSAPSHCQTISFQYKIKSIDGQATATVSVGFTNCVCQSPLDVVYCVDSSGSIGKYEFNNRVRPFLVDVTNQLDIGSGDTQIRVGIVQFSNNAVKETNSLLTIKDGTKKKPGVTYVVEHMSYQAGSTNTKAGLQASKELLQNGRSGVKKLIIVLTDGEYTVGGNPKTLAQSIYNTEGWRIIAIAVGDFDTSKIKELVKNPAKDYFEVTDFDALSSALQSVVTAACDS